MYFTVLQLVKIWGLNQVQCSSDWL